MTNTVLFFRSLVVIVILAGFAHLFAYATTDNQPEIVAEEVTTGLVGTDVNILAKDAPGELNVDATDMQKVTPMAYDSDTDYIIGKWKVTYNNDEYKGAIVYNLKKEGVSFTAYTFQYEDENGYAEPAEGAKALTIDEFDGYQGKGTYILEYEGAAYEINCQIDMVDENTFKLSYDYQGYSDVETWKRY